MADVRLTIAARSYDVNCSDGQEQQLIALGAMIDDKARGIVGTTESRQLLFAALMLADELQELRAAAPQTDPDKDGLKSALAAAQKREDELQAQQAELQATLAEAASEIGRLTAAADGQVQAQAALQARLEASETECERARSARDEALAAVQAAQAGLVNAPATVANPAHGRALSQIADRIEMLAERFEQLS